jgi:pyridoxamine 5'-phosphate oxidase
MEEFELAGDWLTQVRAWLSAAEAAGVREPTAMVLATASPDGEPSARSVLLKGLDERGLVFFTNYRSRKARELDANPHAALLFHWWEPVHRQVVVEGTVARVPADESDAYFATRPHASRLGALASPQSSVIASRDELDRSFAELADQYPEGTDPLRPDWWGGYRVVPHAVEFWEGRANRLHDRLRFSRAEGGDWKLERLAP